MKKGNTNIQLISNLTGISINDIKKLSAKDAMALLNRVQSIVPVIKTTFEIISIEGIESSYSTN